MGKGAEGGSEGGSEKWELRTGETRDWGTGVRYEVLVKRLLCEVLCTWTRCRDCVAEKDEVGGSGGWGLGLETPISKVEEKDRCGGRRLWILRVDKRANKTDEDEACKSEAASQRPGGTAATG